jgi:segregation and condensation protein A
LVDQYLLYVEAARGRLDLVADYLVMAAWLALLKSKLLLPKAERIEAAPDPDDLATLLRRKLIRLEEVRAAAERLGALPQMGRDVFAFGAPIEVATDTRLAWTAELHDLLTAYCAARSRTIRVRHKVTPRSAYALDAARRRLEEQLEALQDWSRIETLAPRFGSDGPPPASCVASLFGAALELVRDQKLEARQQDQNLPLMLRRRRA